MSAIPAGHFQVTYRGDMARRKTAFQKSRLALLVVVLAAVPMVVSNYWLNVATSIAIAVPGALALSLLTGVAGQISMGNAAFMGIGGTSAAVLATQWEWPFLATVVFAGAATGLVGVLVGIPSLRVRGLYLIIATLALHFVMAFGIARVQGDLVGEAGFLMPTATVAGAEIAEPELWYWLLLAFAAVVTLAHVNIVRTRMGRAWLAIREKDLAAEIIGVPVARYKIQAFVFTSAIIGVQGALQAYYIGVVNYDAYSLNLAIAYIAMIIIGGLGSPVGAIYGAIFVTALPYVLTRLFDRMPPALAEPLQSYAFEVQALIYGLLVILFLIFEPKGIAEITRRIREYFVLWPFSRERLADEDA